MRSHLQFFMSEADQREFVTEFADQADVVDQESADGWFFRIGAVGVEFSPSPRSKGRIALGRIAVATHFGENVMPAAQEAERLYKKMRSWMRNRYWNRLDAQNITIPGSATSYRSMWLGPNARELAHSGAVTLWTILGGRIIAREEPNKAPEPTPGSVTPRAIEGVSK
jgi:hypothetical protein